VEKQNCKRTLKSKRENKLGSKCSSYFLALNPSSTSRRMASDSDGVSGWSSAQRTIDARIAGSARKPINGLMPVAGRPMTFCLTVLAFFILFV
jgi:hypothetical protein